MYINAAHLSPVRCGGGGEEKEVKEEEEGGKVIKSIKRMEDEDHGKRK